jgi:peptidase E
MTVYLLGGFNTWSWRLSPIDQRCIVESVNKSIYVVDLTSEDSAITRLYRPVLTGYFLALGASSVGYVSLASGPEEIAQRFNESGIIYVPGGDTELLIRNMDRLALAPLFQTFEGAVAGNSAGAVALCKEAVLTMDDDVKETTVLPGIGLVNYSVDPHYDDSHDAELFELSSGRIIYGVPEESAIIQDGQTEFFGPIWRFKDGRKEQVN